MISIKKVSLLTMAIAIAAVVTIGVIYKTQPVRAFNPQPDPPGFGLVGLTQGQSLRINVTNPATPPDPNLPPDPIRVVMAFRNTDGELFRNGEGNPIRRIVLLRAGESAALGLNADDFARSFDGNGRLQLRPVVQIQQADGVNGSPPDPCLPSVEVINNANARTQFMLPFVTAPQPATQPQ
jgi:hypothetical protein